MIAVPGRLKDDRDLISQYDFRDWLTEYPVAGWQKYFGEDADFLALRERNPESVSRQDFAAIADAGLTEAACSRQLFFMTMIWGYGDRGYGAYRTARMLSTPDAQTQIETAFHLVSKGNVIQAYRTLRLNWCGPTYMTKFLYAAGLCTRSEPMPPILDSVVARSLTKLLHAQGDDPEQFFKLNSGGMPQRYPEGYERYMLTLNAWAQELDVFPDAIEYHLFDIELLANGGAVRVQA